MALELSINICQSRDCTGLEFTETTGAYNATSNTTGWGAPNADLGDVVTATLTISGDEMSSDSVFDMVAEGFPTDDSDVIFDISNADLSFGAASPITDGVYEFLYEITTATTSYEVSVVKLFYCNIQCQVNSMLADLQVSDPDCNDCTKEESSKEALLAWTYLQSLKHAAECGDESRFTKILKILRKIVLNQDCNCH